MGLKENVIIGKLIPAGAGLTAYRKLAEELVPDVEAEEEAVENVYACLLYTSCLLETYYLFLCSQLSGHG